MIADMLGHGDGVKHHPDLIGKVCHRIVGVVELRRGGMIFRRKLDNMLGVGHNFKQRRNLLFQRQPAGKSSAPSPVAINEDCNLEMGA